MKTGRQQPTCQAAGPARIRNINRKAVLNEIRLHGPRSRSELIRTLGLSAAAVSTIVGELLEDDLLRPVKPAIEPVTSRGRPQSPLELNPNAACALGLRLQPVDQQLLIHMAWIDYANTPQRITQPLICETDNLDHILRTVHKAFRQLEKRVADEKRIIGAVIAIPGLVSNTSIQFAPSLKVIEGDAFYRGLLQQTHYPIEMDNDVNLAVRFELYEKAEFRQQNFAYLYIGSGVGAGIGLGGEIWTSNGWAGEIGHLTLSRGDKGNQSFEALLATHRQLSDQLERIGLPRDGLNELADIAQREDAAKIIAEYAQLLHELVQVLNSVLGLDEVVIDFPSGKLLQLLLDRVDQLIDQQPLKLRVSAAESRHVAVVQGAALAALEKYLDRVEQRIKLSAI